MKHTTLLTGALALILAAAPALGSTTIVCSYFLNGRCIHGDKCVNPHVGVLSAAPAMGPAPQTGKGGKGNTQNGGKGKTPGAPNNNIRKQDRPCWKFVDNQPCDEATCPWTHRAATEDEIRARRSFSASRKKGGGGGGKGDSGSQKEPCRRFQEGTCHYGDKCKFSHEGGSATTPRNTNAPPAGGGTGGKGRRGRSAGRPAAAPAAVDDQTS